MGVLEFAIPSYNACTRYSGATMLSQIFQFSRRVCFFPGVALALSILLGSISSGSILSGSILPSIAFAAEPHPSIELWPEGAPGSEGKTGKEAVRVTPNNDHVVSNVHRPTIQAYLPSKGTATGAAVLVMPGGGHRELWMDHEGYEVAQWLSDHGVAAFVLKYRLARQEGSTYTIEGNALADAQRAVRTIRSHAAEWGVDPARLGVMGFSAGGEVAGLAAARGADGDPQAAAAVDRESSRVAFQALVYPGRSDAILPAKNAPPAFLLCGENDRPDISQGLPKLYLRFKEVGVSAELHVLAGVGHGFGFRTTDPGPTAKWVSRFRDWLDGKGLLSSAGAAAAPRSKP
jgi:acetyl esterase/lipase